MAPDYQPTLLSDIPGSDSHPIPEDALSTGSLTPESQMDFPQSFNQESSSRPSTLALIKDPIARNVLISYSVLAFHGAGTDVIFPLWMFIRVEDGGIGLMVRTVPCCYIRTSAVSILSLLLSHLKSPLCSPQVPSCKL